MGPGRQFSSSGGSSSGGETEQPDEDEKPGEDEDEPGDEVPAPVNILILERINSAVKKTDLPAWIEVLSKKRQERVD